MRMMRTLLFSFAPLFALACIVGCGGSTSTVATVPVTGTVTLDGKPVEGAAVSFAPKTKGCRAAFGRTDASGKFKLTTVNTLL